MSEFYFWAGTGIIALLAGFLGLGAGLLVYWLLSEILKHD
jgi:hypothetical protein